MHESYHCNEKWVLKAKHAFPVTIFQQTAVQSIIFVWQDTLESSVDMTYLTAMALYHK